MINISNEEINKLLGETVLDMLKGFKQIKGEKESE